MCRPAAGNAVLGTHRDERILTSTKQERSKLSQELSTGVPAAFFANGGDGLQGVRTARRTALSATEAYCREAKTAAGNRIVTGIASGSDARCPVRRRRCCGRRSWPRQREQGGPRLLRTKRHIPKCTFRDRTNSPANPEARAAAATRLNAISVFASFDKSRTVDGSGTESDGTIRALFLPFGPDRRPQCRQLPRDSPRSSRPRQVAVRRRRGGVTGRRQYAGLTKARAWPCSLGRRSCTDMNRRRDTIGRGQKSGRAGSWWGKSSERRARAGSGAVRAALARRACTSVGESRRNPPRDSGRPKRPEHGVGRAAFHAATSGLRQRSQPNAVGRLPGVPPSEVPGRLAHGR